MATKILKCAVYTRKSTEHGLELEFNSLHAQREACEAFIKSQVAEGWRLVPTAYDDAAYSGGGMDRPALQQLLKDIEVGLIDVIVVYKIDRLTRSLADFAKLVEIFDAKGISFVAVTQQFNTTTSMGRLTLNILLSFAQFERELSSERVRDKVAASRKKGKWTGGSVPLGYDAVNKKLVVNKEEAKTVRMIFGRYLALRSFQKVIDELNAQHIVSKARHTKKGNLGSVSFTYGPLAYLLKNRTYLGEVGYRGSWFPGEHEPIVDGSIFDRVQELLRTNAEGRTGKRHSNGALLSGLLFDDQGNRMSPSFTVKKGVRYRFYVSSALLRGKKAQKGSATRISADKIESAIVEAMQNQLFKSKKATPEMIANTIRDRVDRIIIDSEKINILLKPTLEEPEQRVCIPRLAYPDINPKNAERPSQPIAADQRLLQAIVRAHSWIRLLCEGHHESVESLAGAVALNPKVIRNTIRLAFIDPTLIKAALQGDNEDSLSLKQFNGLVPMSWKRQHEWIKCSN